MQTAPCFSLWCIIICLWGKVKTTNFTEPWPSPQQNQSMSPSRSIEREKFQYLYHTQKFVQLSMWIRLCYEWSSMSYGSNSWKFWIASAATQEGTAMLPYPRRATFWLLSEACVWGAGKKWKIPGKSLQHLEGSIWSNCPQHQQGSSYSAKLCTVTIFGPFSNSCGWLSSSWKLESKHVLQKDYF